MNCKSVKIAITGFPGTGKSSLASALSKKLNLPMAEENLAGIIEADRLYRGRKGVSSDDALSLRSNLIKEFYDWNEARSRFYQECEGFIADRWELDVLGWWLVRFGADSRVHARHTALLLQNFQKAASMMDLVILMPFVKPFAGGFNERGGHRVSAFATHVLTMSLDSGLLSSFAPCTSVLRLPPECTSLEDRLERVEAELMERL
ncbi:MAG: AAA family ATPase [Synechococcus sp.]|nr:AAA family ATPase [Synechococcus sp.]